jgi:hypothetical protein
VPRFEGRDNLPVGGAPSFWNSRAGVYRGSEHALQRWQASSFAEARVWLLRLRASAGWQDFFGAEADSLEFSPAPYFGETAVRLTLPRNFRAEARLQGMGPKHYRGFGVSLRTPPHLENHLALEQGLFANRVLARLAFFHAFGDEVLEHPLGNPLRFRIVAGLDWALP